MLFNIYFGNDSNENLNQLQLRNSLPNCQEQDNYSLQNIQNNYQSSNSLNQFSYSDINNNQITTSPSDVSSLNTNEYTTSDTTLYHQISSSIQSNWNDETQILDSICPINITYLPSFSTFFK